MMALVMKIRDSVTAGRESAASLAIAAWPDSSPFQPTDVDRASLVRSRDINAIRIRDAVFVLRSPKVTSVNRAPPEHGIIRHLKDVSLAIATFKDRNQPTATS